ncbi:uncharacterized protein METZ01_LOCUS20518 [marine metagenome]|uniref:Uncharacterized protein n=1 Tax=marine metagenome TaxID=408172 RepID=A0A381PM22_9ZZZZ
MITEGLYECPARPQPCRFREVAAKSGIDIPPALVGRINDCCHGSIQELVGERHRRFSHFGGLFSGQVVEEILHSLGPQTLERRHQPPTSLPVGCVPGRPFFDETTVPYGQFP